MAELSASRIRFSFKERNDSFKVGYHAIYSLEDLRGTGKMSSEGANLLIRTRGRWRMLKAPEQLREFKFQK